MNEELIMGYKAFLDNGKTERECVSQAVSLAKAKGYSELCEKTELKPGDKVYFINRVMFYISHFTFLYLSIFIFYSFYGGMMYAGKEC